MIIRESVLRRLIKEVYEEWDEGDVLSDEELKKRRLDNAGIYGREWMKSNMKWHEGEFPGIEKMKWWGEDQVDIGDYDYNDIDVYSEYFLTHRDKQIYNSFVFQRDCARWQVLQKMKELRNCDDSEVAVRLEKEIESKKKHYEYLKRECERFKGLLGKL